MAEKTTLTSDELAFINGLMHRSGRHAVETSPGFVIDGGPQPNDLLKQLASHSSLSLDAQFDDYCMTFPLQISEDEFHTLRVQLAPPTIYERGPTLRAWRLHLEQPLPLLRENGAKSALSVHELSPTGLVVDAGRRRKAPEQFHLRLALPGDNALQVDARRVREVEGGLTAYEVAYPQEKDAERVRHFIFSQHRRLHPQLRPDIGADLV